MYIKPHLYIGGSAMPDNEKKGRISEYESSIRLPQHASRATLGRYRNENHPNTPLDIKKAHTFKIAASANDPLETFLKEAILIDKYKPQMVSNYRSPLLVRSSIPPIVRN